MTNAQPMPVRSAWVRVLAGSLAWMVAMFIAIMIVNMFPIPPLIVFSIAFAILAWAVMRWWTKRWLLILTSVLVVLVVLLNIPFVIQDLMHPETPFTFIPTVISLLAGLVAFVASIAALTNASTRSLRPAVWGAVALGAVAVVVSLGMFVTLEDPAAAAGDVTVVAEDIEYPETLTATAGAITFFLENRDIIRHTFVLENQNVKEELPGLAQRRVEATLAAGTYRFFCDVPGHEEAMEGTLTVR